MNDASAIALLSFRHRATDQRLHRWPGLLSAIRFTMQCNAVTQDACNESAAAARLQQNICALRKMLFLISVQTQASSFPLRSRNALKKALTEVAGHRLWHVSSIGAAYLLETVRACVWFLSTRNMSRENSHTNETEAQTTLVRSYR